MVTSRDLTWRDAQKCRVDVREFALYRAAALASDVDEIVVVNARHPEIESATTRLEPVWRAEVERLVPSGTAGAGPDAGSRALVDAWQRHRFFEGLARALIGVGRRTLLVGLVERMPVSPGLTSSIAKGSRSWVRGCGSLPLPPRWRVSRAALRCSNWRWRPSSW